MDFEGVEIGEKITAEELLNRVSKVTPTMASVGITLEEWSKNYNECMNNAKKDEE